MKTHLILDEMSVSHSAGVTFHLNQAAKHPANPVLMPGVPGEWDSLQICWPGTVLYDAEAGLFRCWYSGLNAIAAERPPGHWEPGYAESRDGIHWTKPPLGQVEYRDRDTNRITVDWSEYINSAIWFNPDQSNPERRFLAYWVTVAQERWAMALAASPDGKVWRHERTAYREDERPGHLFICQVLYEDAAADPDWRAVAISQVMSKRRSDGKGRVRHITLLHGPDAGELSVVRHGPERDDHYVIEPEPGIDDEIHLASMMKIGDTYLMLFESDRFATQPPRGDLKLAATTNVRHFRRVHPQAALVPMGERGAWDENLLVTSTASFLEVGDEVWIYYFGCPAVFTNWPPNRIDDASLRGSYFYPVCLGLATLPRDRFAYAAGPGSVTLDLDLAADEVWLNADGDNITLEAADAAGRKIATGRPGDLRRDTVYRKVVWEAVPEGATRLHISVGHDGRLYSVRA